MMQDNKSIIEVKGKASFVTKPKPVTQERMQRDLDYYLAQKILGKMFGEGIVSDDEFKKITDLNKRNFLPYLAKIMD